MLWFLGFGEVGDDQYSALRYFGRVHKFVRVDGVPCNGSKATVGLDGFRVCSDVDDAGVLGVHKFVVGSVLGLQFEAGGAVDFLSEDDGLCEGVLNDGGGGRIVVADSGFMLP
jgi:hypothetical protein